MKTIDHALELRGRIFGAFEMAEHESDPVARRRWLTFVVVGAGPTGVELVGQLAELLRRSLRRNFRHIDPADARVLLLDAGPRSFPIEIHVGTAVTHVDERGLETNSAVPELHRIEAATARSPVLITCPTGSARSFGTWGSDWCGGCSTR